LNFTIRDYVMASEVRKIQLKPYKLAELCGIYEVSKPTFRKWINELKELGKRNGHYYSIPQVKIIFANLLLPTYIEIED
jgi:hypothetical protein